MIPEFVAQLRSKVGHDQLFLPGVTCVVVKPVPEGAPASSFPEVLLVKRSDNGNWTPVTGIAEPGEDPHVSAEREVLEETGVEARVVSILGAGRVGPVTYDNGDVTEYVDITFRLEICGNDVPRVGDDESTQVGWFSIMNLPEMKPRFRLHIGDAVAQMRHPEGYRQRFGYHKRDSRSAD